MASLLDLLASSPLSAATREIRFRESTITIRALTAREMEMLQGVHPRPGPPSVVRPGTHPETGPLYPNEHDPVYRRMLETWLRRYRIMEVAASAGATTASGMGFNAAMGSENLRIWAEEVAGVIAGAASDGEIIRVWEAVRDLSDPVGGDGDRIAEAKKALSALRPEELRTVLGSFPTGTA